MIETISDPGRFARLREDWNRLADAAGDPFLRHEWFLACAGALTPRGRLRILALFSGERLIAAAPMMAVGDGVGARLEFLGATRLGEPCGLLYRDPAALESLVREMAGLGLPLLLRRLRSQSEATRALRRIPWRRGLLVRRATAPSLRIPVRTGWQSYLDSLSSRHRYDLRRARRRAAGLGPVDFRLLGPGAGEASSLLDRFMDVEAAGWKGRGESALRFRTGLRAFFTEFGLAAAAARILRIALLNIGEETAAAMIAVEHSGALWVLKIGYDERYRSCSPGLILTAETIRSAFESGLAGYEFLGAEEPWQRPWRPERRHYESAGFFPGSLRGAWALAREAGRAAVARLGGLPAAGRSRARGR